MLPRLQLAPRLSGLASSVIGTKGEGNAADDEQFASQICIANIGPRQRHRRLMFGVYVFAVALVALVVMLVLRLDVWWRLLLFLLFAPAAVGYYQARDRT
jgi:predicted nucleic acid-binding Zn ribbon protein